MTSARMFQDRISVSELRAELALHGWSCVPLEPGDVTGESMQEIVRALGTPIVQNAAGATVWNVRHHPEAARRINAPRSWTLDEFPFHTDGSFEDPQPSHIALYVVQADRYGGGQTQLKNVAKILSHVTPASLRALRSTRFRIHVPDEFTKDVGARRLPIVYGDGLMRYRRELIDDRDATDEQRVALSELVDAVETVQPVCLNLRSSDLLVVDNGRWLHARTEIRDPQRHLLRMRFEMEG